MTHKLPFPKGVSVSFSGSAVFLEMDFVINQNNGTVGLQQLARRVLSVHEQIQSEMLSFMQSFMAKIIVYYQIFFSFLTLASK